MQIQSTMLYFLHETDVERFEMENRSPQERYFAGLLPQTTTHFISQNDFQGDEHFWLAREGYEHSSGFEITFSTQDEDALRIAILTELLEQEYAVCAWPDRVLFQITDYQIDCIVETDLLNAALKVPSVDLSRIVRAFTHIDVLRRKAKTTDDVQHGLYTKQS